MEIKAILFDMDGVLVKSEPIIKKAAKKALLEYGVQAKDDDFIPFIGAGEDRFVGGVAESYGVTYRTEMKTRTYEIYFELLKNGIEVISGVHSTIEKIRAMGLKTAVCSAADRVKVIANLKAASIPLDSFEVIITGDDVQNKKPAPDVFLKAAEQLGILPKHCLVIEDAINGIQAAQSGGMHSIGLTTSFSREMLEKQAPDAVCDNIGDIISYI